MSSASDPKAADKGERPHAEHRRLIIHDTRIQEEEHTGEGGRIQSTKAETISVGQAKAWQVLRLLCRETMVPLV